MADDVHQADAVQMAVNVVGNGNESAFGKLEPLGIADQEVRPDLVQDSLGEIRSGGDALFLHVVVNLVHVVDTGNPHAGFIQHFPQPAFEDGEHLCSLFSTQYHASIPLFS